ncbi:MAG: Uma2 family endonuclease [Verrucomicrobiales bacterium]|nr:Uma2 family endonuclease [Verrucomicrobiales bacterium]
MSLSNQQQPSGVSRHKIRRAEYHLLSKEGLLPVEGKIELLGGEIFEMSPSGPLHSTVVDEIYDLIRNQISPDIAKIRNEKAIVLDDFSEPEPDVAVVKPGDYTERHPTGAEVLLLIEVSKSSLEYDREIKLPTYATSGIPEVWIINLNEGMVEIYQNPTGNSFADKRVIDSKAEDPVLTPLRLPAFAFSLKEIPIR